MNTSFKQMLIMFYKNILTKSGNKDYSKVMTGLQFSVPVSYLDFLDEVRI